MACLRLEVLYKDQYISNNYKNLCEKFPHLDIKIGYFYLIDTNKYSQVELEEYFFENSKDLLFDPITQYLNFKSVNLSYDISLKHGVTDNTANTLKSLLKIDDIHASVNSGRVFIVNDKSQTFMDYIIQNEANLLLQEVKLLDGNRFVNPSVKCVNISNTDEINVIDIKLNIDELYKLSKEKCWALEKDELKSIVNYFVESREARISKGLPEYPTDIEIEIIAQTWSEHCKHKIFSSPIRYKNRNTVLEIHSLFKDYIKKVTFDVKEKFQYDWLISVFKDNAGIVRFDNKLDICFKVETHNSPSALDPYGGAITGILGVNRDIMACGIGAKPVANTNVFCFPPPTLEEKCFELLPKNVMSPKRVLYGVHKGVEDGGNKSGIPTVNGAFNFHTCFAGKPLVYVGTVGVLPHNINGKPSSFKKAQPGDHIVMVGGRVGIDGIHGATFSSLELDQDSPSSAVQIGDPITQKKVSDFLQTARDHSLYNSITDNGAGGLSSSVGEMAEESNGASIYIDKIPLKYVGLAPYEIIISESQERITFAVPETSLLKFLKFAEDYNVEATVIGEFNSTGLLNIYKKNELISSLDLDFLHNGNPENILNAVWDENFTRNDPYSNSQKHVCNIKLKEKIKKILTNENITSKENLIRQYDHEVQGATHIKPLFSKDNKSSPANAGVIWLEPHGGEIDNAIAIGCGLSPLMSKYDPYLMAIKSVDECVRNLICSGGDLSHMALLDNFCWPDPIESKKNPDGAHKLAQLVRTCQGLYDVCFKYGLPLISGKDSMKNDYRGVSNNGLPLEVSIEPTLLISGVAKTNIKNTIPSYVDKDRHLFYIGHLYKTLKGSIHDEYFVNQSKDEDVSPDLETTLRTHQELSKLIDNKRINSIHDISEGGFLTCLLEKLFLNNIGIELNEIWDDYELFSEGLAGYIISCDSINKNLIENLKGIKTLYLGMTNSSGLLNVNHKEEGQVTLCLSELYGFWNRGLCYE